MFDTERSFTGQIFDSGTGGLGSYNARYYDATLGRFVSPDSIVPDPANPADWHRYAYVINNPLSYVDPSGHEWQCTTVPLYTITIQICRWHEPVVESFEGANALMDALKAGELDDLLGIETDPDDWSKRPRIDIIKDEGLLSTPGSPDPRGSNDDDDEDDDWDEIDAYGKTYRFNSHSLERLTEREVSSTELRYALQKTPVKYSLRGEIRYGFYDDHANIFVAVDEDNYIRTVITDFTREDFNALQLIK